MQSTRYGNIGSGFFHYLLSSKDEENPRRTFCSICCGGFSPDNLFASHCYAYAAEELSFCPSNAETYQTQESTDTGENNQSTVAGTISHC
jgi:hypothetical protein